jgi:hypothetical protein
LTPEASKERRALPSTRHRLPRRNDAHVTTREAYEFTYETGDCEQRKVSINPRQQELACAAESVKPNSRRMPVGVIDIGSSPSTKETPPCRFHRAC